MRHILKKLCQCNTVSKFSENQRRVELKSVWNFVARAVLVESANQVSLEAISTIRPSGKTLMYQYDFLQLSNEMEPGAGARKHPHGTSFAHLLRKPLGIW